MLTILSLLVGSVGGVMVYPTRPPRGWNSFDLQYDKRANPAIETWNETFVLPSLSNPLPFSTYLYQPFTIALVCYS